MSGPTLEQAIAAGIRQALARRDELIGWQSDHVPSWTSLPVAARKLGFCERTIKRHPERFAARKFGNRWRVDLAAAIRIAGGSRD